MGGPYTFIGLVDGPLQVVDLVHELAAHIDVGWTQKDNGGEDEDEGEEEDRRRRVKKKARERERDAPALAFMEKPARRQPSTSLWGSWRMISRSLQVPGSPSSALMTRYDGLATSKTIDYKPARSELLIICIYPSVLDAQPRG